MNVVPVPASGRAAAGPRQLHREVRHYFFDATRLSGYAPLRRRRNRMRLRKIAQTLEEWYPKLRFSGQQLSHNNWRIQGAAGAVSAAEQIRRTGALTEDADGVLAQVEIAHNVQREIVVSEQMYTAFSTAVSTLRTKAELLLNAIRSLLPPDDAHLLSFRLPDEQDLDNIAATMRELQTVLSQAIVNPAIDGEARVVSFDRGSNWIDIIVGSAGAVTVIGQLLRLITSFQLKQAEIAGKREVVRNLALQNDFTEAAERTLEQELATYLDTGVGQIATAAGVGEDNEYRERLKFSMKVLGDLITRGLEVHPSLTAPADIQEVFPKPKEIAAAMKHLEGAKKQLPE